MRIIGMDLAVTGAHKAVVMSEQGEYVSPVLSLRTQPDELGRLLKRGSFQHIWLLILEACAPAIVPCGGP